MAGDELSVSEAIYLALIMASFPILNVTFIPFLLVVWLGVALGQRLVRVLCWPSARR
ncbi:MAG: hypothetical protein Q4G36_11760 [Paracoccus sp. (in: a-proteobacteria)]|nr:hypothetical protein [Paracoccus sp. (in: a-proteobacteria)]